MLLAYTNSGQFRGGNDSRRDQLQQVCRGLSLAQSMSKFNKKLITAVHSRLNTRKSAATSVSC